MVVSQPHFLLFCDTHLSNSQTRAVESQGFGRWHFVLERLDGPERIEAADSESEVHRDRLALLAVVRGLEALEQPSQVTLITTSRYVSRGLRFGLSEWREAEYTWEHFGVQKPIRNADLWQRIDRAMQFHQVTCRLLQSPLMQAVVDSATELDEISFHAQPIGNEVCSKNLVACKPPSEAIRVDGPEATKLPPTPGIIRRVDAAHSLGLSETNLASGTGPKKIQEPPERETLQHRQSPNNIQFVSGNALAAGLGTPDLSIIHRRLAPCRSPNTHSEAKVDGIGQSPRDGTCQSWVDGDRIHTERQNDVPTLRSQGRLKIRIAIPIFVVRWWQAASDWLDFIRSKFRVRTQSPIIAPT